jgi:pilus assembly protein CpaB
MTTMRRVLVVLSALVLAAFGALVLVSYVRGADARAEAGAVLVPVLVVDAQVPAGTSVDDLADSVSTAQVPQRLVATGALGDLADVEGLSTTVDLLPGDQVVAARFADPAVQAAGAVAVPAGLQEISLTLEPQRAVDGDLDAGDEVGVYISSGGLDVTATTPAVTALVVDRALVTRVSSTGGGADLTGAGQTVTVTLALHQADAARVIAGAGQDGVWLSLQSAAGSADTSPTSTTTTPGDDQ